MMMANSGIGWFGPQIDLSDAPSHVGGFVQLLVFVHRSVPLQYKLPKGGEVIRTDIQVGDDTRPRFTVSLWQKQMGSLAMSGDVILLQNVKIVKFGDVLSARTVQYSSLLPLIHPYDLLVSRGVDDLIGSCRVSVPTKEKLRKVIEWVKTTRSIPHNFSARRCQTKLLPRNWKVLEEGEHKECLSLSEVLQLSSSCTALFQASIGEIFLPLAYKAAAENEYERMFISWRLNNSAEYTSLADDFICIGCQSCGSSLDTKSNKQNYVPLYCERSSSRLHTVGLIYRTFMLYVWDEEEYIPLLVKNKAAEVLFGNIKADKVHQYCKPKNEVDNSKLSLRNIHSQDLSEGRSSTKRQTSVCQTRSGKVAEPKEERRSKYKDVNFHSIWLILLKLLLQQGKNSPLKFEVNVNTSLDIENGRFELVSLSMPCPITKCSSF